jgi:O-antigen ligase
MYSAEVAHTTAIDLGQAPPHKPGRNGELLEAYVSLLLFMAVYCARPEDWIPGLSHVPLAKVAGVLALLAFLLSLRKIRQRFRPEVICLIFLFLQLFTAALLSPVWRGGALSTTLDFGKVVLIVLVMFVALSTAKRLHKLLFVQAASVAAISAVAVWKGHMLGSRLEGVLNGNYSNPNDLAISIVISLPLCLALSFLSRGRFGKAAWAFAAVVMGYAVLLTGSRSGFISLAIATGLCLWEFAIRGRRFYLLALASVIGIVLCVFSGSIVGERLKGTFNPADDVASAYGSAQQRQQLLWRSIEVTAQHPLFGVGPGDFQVLSGDWHVTHNSYTQIASEGGLPALALYLTIFFYGFHNLRAAKRLSRRNGELNLLAGAIRASMVGFIVGSFFASYAYQFFPYFLVAYSTALFRVSRNASTVTKQAPVRHIVPETVCTETASSELSWRAC